jgi:hypothetical protein
MIVVHGIPVRSSPGPYRHQEGRFPCAAAVTILLPLLLEPAGHVASGTTAALSPNSLEVADPALLHVFGFSSPRIPAVPLLHISTLGGL